MAEVDHLSSAASVTGNGVFPTNINMARRSTRGSDGTMTSTSTGFLRKVDSKMVKETSTIRAEILRSVRLARTLRRMGRYWRTSPIDLPPDKRAGLWELSEPCERLDWFLSHTWLTPGWLKYLALLLSSQWLPALLIGLATAVILICLDTAEQLPRIDVHGNDVCPWATIPPLVSVVFLIIAPKLIPNLGPRVFFDATCINQVDESLKTEGVYSLAGFLAHADKLVVLWSPSYFNRIWCVYEVAMFAAMKRKSSKIVFKPPFLYCLYFALFICFTMNSSIGVAAVLAFHNPWHLLLCKLVLMFPAAVLAIHLLRPYLWRLKQLPMQMENFDFNQAQCRTDYDRKVVEYFIKGWYGSTENFNTFVRGPLKETVCDHKHAVKLPWKTLLVVMSPRFCYTALWIVVQARAGMQGMQLAFFATGALLWDATMYAVSLKCMLLLITYFSEPLSSKVADFGVTVGLALARAVYVTFVEGTSFVEIVDHSLFNHQPWFISCYLAVGAIAAGLTFKQDVCLYKRHYPDDFGLEDMQNQDSIKTSRTSKSSVAMQSNKSMESIPDEESNSTNAGERASNDCDSCVISDDGLNSEIQVSVVREGIYQARV